LDADHPSKGVLFPRRITSNEPLLDKGIALAGDSTLWLTAETIRALPLDAMHVGVRACLCGVVRQITSREALGMVWAVLGAGAASLTAALWSVDIPSASDFYARFYAEWLGDHQNRAVAHARACRALRAQAGPRAHPYHYAPFVLTASTLEGDIA
jgi:CHAT domain-containing protein